MKPRHALIACTACWAIAAGCSGNYQNGGDAGGSSSGSSSGSMSDGGSSSGSSSGASGADACSTPAEATDLTPTTGTVQQATTFGVQTFGYLITFSCAAKVTGIEFTASFSSSAVAHVWDTNGNVLATGSTVYPNSGVQWYRSNIAFSASAGERYIVGIYADVGFLGDTWDNVALPFTVNGVTVVQSCEGACTAACGIDAGPPGDVAPKCSLGGVGRAIRIDTQ